VIAPSPSLPGLAPSDPDRPVAIEVSDLGVRYSLRFTKKTTVRTTFQNLLQRRDGPSHFWALKDVNFRVPHGECLAVIGPNGAGKSTLLQVLAGILTPSEGNIEVRGQISSLLTLGAGFDQDLSGRDNILLAGAFLGIDHRDMLQRIDGIVDFADLGQFIDAPIKTYSSGMRARLGFSIATSVDPDVLLLDEVLSTGDQVFRAKSYQRIVRLMSGAKAIVLVTHDMNWVTEFCNRAILLERGKIIAEGEPVEIVKLHQERSERARIDRDAEVARRIAAVEASLGDTTSTSARTGND
jgi:ABC-2 type transport system ATP-binding protein